jgi:hypothetical protein
MKIARQHKPYSFDKEAINKWVKKESIGNYRLGILDKEGDFIPIYVGHSDTDLNERLHQQYDKYGKSLSHFKFAYADTVIDAYFKECENYHKYCGNKGKLKNDIHPDLPKGFSDSELRCPYCPKTIHQV